MCGIFGATTSRSFVELYLLNRGRGDFSYGGLYYKKDLITIIKNKDDMSSLVPHGYNIYLGHTRAPTNTITYFNFNRIINIQNFESRLTDLMNVKYILSLNDLQSEKLIKIFEEGQTKVYENKNFYPRIFLTEDLIEVNNEQEMIEAMFDESIDLAKTAIVYKKDKINIGLDNLNAGESTEIIDYQPNEVRIKTNLNTEKLLILSDVYYPSWKVYINGQEKKIHKVDYILRGVTIPKGKHEVFFKNSLW